ncbi:phage Gp37/Gp68 family protein [Komarekiella sp. 'clone 1']|uniref:Phage Gp37/Gp68 family protein n=1 Tax=Komarekiella delphini-convector SJRDD-AB1 TaxID=2593771 RepID=A0AA40T342_9NOST|nr:phage Gp37/Gp68 family protein [Komarekiella delphini-convector]MBD6620016.1 phage Gp37/Gp68 family protein [Komarekiella delphini-convector SJRDD-AB1]
MATNIEWTDETWNIIVGCSRVPESPGCARCYAATAAKSPRLQQFSQYQAVSKWDGTVQFVESQLLKPLHWRKPKKIFVCSMADLFHANVPFEWIDQVMAVVALCPQHTFQVLTKRPERALEYFSQPKLWVKWYEAAKEHLRCEIGEKFGGLINLQQYFIEQPFPLPNLWLGISTENQAMADKRIPILLQIPAAVRFLSCEPLLENIQLSAIADSNWQHNLSWHPGQPMGTIDPLPQLSWVILGGESGPGSRPCHIEWLESIVQQCTESNTPVFVKQLGANAHHQGQRLQTRDRKDGEIDEFPEQLRIREFPVLVHK